MGTWAGALIKTGISGDFSIIAAKHRIQIDGPVTSWLLVQADVNLLTLP